MTRWYEKDFQTALSCSQQAIELLPDAKLIREAHAMLLFHSALSSVIAPKLILDSITPIDSIFIKTDKQSLSYLTQAADIFQGLLNTCELEHDLKQKQL